jgi:hypothetical protein
MEMKVTLRNIYAFLLCISLITTSCNPQDANALKKIAQAIETYNIAFIGDSYAAGEGNPDRFINESGGLFWSNRQCHRSKENGRTSSIDRLDNTGNDLFAIESFDAACSGATIDVGLLGAYRGVIVPGEVTDPLDPQIAQVKHWMELMRLDKLDALVITIGGNDVGFAEVVSKCLTGIEKPCNVSFDLDKLLNTGIPDRPGSIGFDNLADAYQRLDNQIHDAFDSSPNLEVFLVGYPDPLRNEKEEFCNNFDEQFAVRPDFSGSLQPTTVIEHYLPTNGQVKFISKDESEWIYNNLVLRLNASMQAAAEQLGWHFVGGLEELTRRHGYCSDEPWFNTLKKSFDRQGDFNGTAHPNQYGYLAYRETITKALVQELQMRHTPPPAIKPDLQIKSLAVGGVELPDHLAFPGNTVRLRATLFPTAATIDSVVLDYSINPPQGRAFNEGAFKSKTANNDSRFSYDNILFADISNKGLKVCDWVYYRWRVNYTYNGQQASTTSGIQKYNISYQPGDLLQPICN